MARAHGKNAFFFVLVTVFIDMMAYGLVMPVLPSLVAELTDTTIAEAVKWAGPISAIYALMNFLFGPVLGNLSDRFGRRPVLLASMGSLGVDFLIMALSQNIWMLFFGRALAGISGATFSTAQAYIADVTTPERRGGAFGMIGAAFGLGFIIGPSLGGVIGDMFGHRAPFYAAAALSTINVLYGIFVLPESLAKEDRRRFELARANPFGAFRHFAKLPMVRWFLVVHLLYALVHTTYPAIWAYHGEIRYGWTQAMTGLTLSLVGLGAAIVQGGLTGRLIGRFGAVKTAWFGLGANAVALLMFAAAGQSWMVYWVLIVSALGGIMGPSLQSIMSNQTPRNAQGELQGASASLQSMAMIFSPIIMTQILFRFSADSAPVYFPGAPFLLAGVLMVISIAPMIIGVRQLRTQTDPTPTQDVKDAA